MAKHSTGATYTSFWDEEDRRAERVVTPKRAIPAHSTGVEYLPPYAPVSAREHANRVRILPDPATGVGTPLGHMPAGMPL
jgi:hypothetical protein